jgi:predicted nucleotidyltransferase
VIERVIAILEKQGIQYALVGGMAVAARGYPRFTADFDLLTTDKSVLQDALWNELRASGLAVDVRKGDFDDPLAGVVRIGSKPEQIDIVVGKWKWEQRVIDRAQTIDVKGMAVRVPITSDLILLKLAAGGPIDQQDIVRLLAVGPRDQLISEVNEKIGELPADARDLWQRLITASSS